MKIAFIFFFFFSSRRRHTRCSRDWSSDVCSSDLLCKSLPQGAQRYTGWCETNHFLFLLRGSAPPWQVQFWRARVPAPHGLNVDRLLPRLANCRQRIACALFLFDPLFFVSNNVEQQLFIFRTRKILCTVLLVAAVVQRLPGLAVELLSGPLSDAAVEPDVGRVELFLAGLQKRVQALDQSRN